MLQHSCVANASKHFDDDGTLTIRAAIPIKKGESVTINYSDPMWGTTSRRAFLKDTKQFLCMCQRCKDPQASQYCKRCLLLNELFT